MCDMSEGDVWFSELCICDPMDATRISGIATFYMMVVVYDVTLYELMNTVYVNMQLHPSRIRLTSITYTMISIMLMIK